MIISAEKSDIVRYYAERDYNAEIFYVVQQKPQGLCDALFRATPFACHHDQVLDRIAGYHMVSRERVSSASQRKDADVNLVLFPVIDPTVFDAVVCDAQDYRDESRGQAG